MRLAVMALAAVAWPAMAGPARLHLASQYRWETKAGYYLSFENEAPEGAAARLATLKLVLGVGDGRQWRFVGAPAGWATTGREYRLRAECGAQSGGLWLDDRLLGRTDGGYQPAPVPVEVNAVPGWADSPTEYVVQPASLRLVCPPAAALQREWPAFAERLPLVLFGAQLDERAEPRMGAEVTIESRFTLLPRPDLRSLAPLIDRWGQARHADWPQKIRSDEDLRRATDEEARRHAAWGTVPELDRYGGWTAAGWREPATGYFAVVQRNGWWWLVTPEGHPCFYLGLCTAPALNWEQTPVTGREFLFEWLPARTGDEGAGWGRDPWGADPGVDYLALHTANLIRRDGAGWRRQSAARLAQRVAAWGFSGLAKWGGQPGLVRTPVLGWADVPRLGRHPDFHDPAIRARCQAALRRQIEPHRADPDILGWSIGNEYDELVTPDEVLDLLARGAAVPAKQALIDLALRELTGGEVAALARRWQVAGVTRADLLAAKPRPAAEDVEVLRRGYSDAYFAFCYQTTKAIDAHHLYLGNWIVPGWWVNESDWSLVARWCDVIGYDNYAIDFADERLTRLIAATGKPVLCGEFSFPPCYEGRRGYGKYPVWAADDQQAGERYQRYVAAGARHPACVGLCWFEYRDQPLTGRGPGHGTQLVYGEHYAFGLVDVTDRPKWELVGAVREANRRAVAQRRAAMDASRG